MKKSKTYKCICGEKHYIAVFADNILFMDSYTFPFIEKLYILFSRTYKIPFILLTNDTRELSQRLNKFKILHYIVKYDDAKGIEMVLNVKFSLKFKLKLLFTRYPQFVFIIDKNNAIGYVHSITEEV